MNAKKPEYKSTFSFGNVVTIVTGLVFAFSLVATLQVGQASAKQERLALKERVVKNEMAVEQVIALREDIIRVTVNQENQSKQVADMLDYLKETTVRVSR